MIRSLLFSILILFSEKLVYAQSKENRLLVPGSEKVHFGNKTTGIPSYIKLSQKVKIEELNTWMSKVFKLNKDHKVKVIKSVGDELGFTHHKLQQYYKGYPVEGAVYIIHEKDNYIHSLNGMLQDNFLLDGKIILSEAEALSKALAYINGKKYIWEDKNEEEHLKLTSNDPSATYYPKGTLVIASNRLGKGSYRLAYKFDIYSTSPLRRAYVYVDANNGAVININDRIHHHSHSKKDTCHADEINEIDHANVNATGTAVTKYSGTQSITTDYTGSVYRLRETGRGNGIQTFNMNRGFSYSSATDFTDADNTWNTTTNYDNAAYDAHWGAEKTYDYFKNTHNLNSYDGLGSIIKSYVHYDTGFDNAYWDGSRMTYGDGSNTFGGFTALTSIDVIGHELTHGITEFSSGLEYADESGALNESFSDMMGTTVEFYAKPATANFLIGEQITYGGGALRSMSNPNLYDQPDTYLGNMWDIAQEVHTNSGVGNYWYYLLCQGASGTNDVGSNFSVTGIGMTKAARIAYRTFTFYLTANSTYADARFYSIQAAMDLYGPCTPEIQSVTNAWYAVGVGSAYVAGVSAQFSASGTSFCSIPSVVTFNNLSQNANTFAWNFGDGATSSVANPSHTYTSYGTFTVTLTATGGACGTDTETKTGYIVVSNLVTCPVSMPVSGIGQTQTQCTGKLYDSGGLSNYEDLTDGTITIAPTGASRVTLSFLSFNFEQDYDYLYIYDGPNTSSPLIGVYTGGTLPNGGTITSSGGSITLNQFSDTYVNESGFNCDWSCTVPTAAPVAAFSANPLASCDGIVAFTDQSTNAPSSWNWTFGDGTTSTLQNPSKTYTASGTYSVTLRSCNTNFGCSSILTKTNYITVNLGSCINLPQSGTGTTQTACSGRIFDSGGSSDYQSGTNGSMTIAPPGATKVTLSFTSFNFESGYDYLYIYDGPSTASNIIGQYSGSNLPGGGTINSTGGSITLRQVSDGIIEESGFVCNWSCTQPTSAPVAAFTATPTSTCDGIVSFTDQSANGPTSWNWTFGDGTTSTSRNPVKTYSSNGTYTVSLNACNSFGCNLITKTSYVNVALGGCININLPQSGSGAIQTNCSGRLYDSGGNSDYQNNTDGTITISPTGASKVNLNFSSFNFESDYDYLYIYDGPNTFSSLIGMYTGATLPGASGIVSSTGGSITLRQTTDNSVTYSGFVCDWTCVASNSKPSPAFTANSTSSCNGVISFTDQSTNNPTSWTWNFGDGTSSSSANPTKTYTTNGTFNVSITACNSFGCNTLVKNNFITINLSGCISLPALGTAANQTSCTGKLYDSGGTGNYTNDTDGTITIAPTGATAVTLSFTSFDFEPGYDYLKIYDGPNTLSPLIGTYSGSSLPGSGTITSSGGSITLRQTSDDSYVHSGFVCDWSCQAITGTNKAMPGETAIDLFPNPASHAVDLSYSYTGIKNLNIVINDLLGNVIYKEEGTFDSRYQKLLDISSFQNGVYFVIINDEAGVTISRKLTIAK
jgi:Zn-dependent metalloprotease